MRIWRTDDVSGLAVVVTDILEARFDHDCDVKSTEVFEMHMQ